MNIAIPIRKQKRPLVAMCMFESSGVAKGGGGGVGRGRGGGAHHTLVGKIVSVGKFTNLLVFLNFRTLGLQSVC